MIDGAVARLSDVCGVVVLGGVLIGVGAGILGLGSVAPMSIVAWVLILGGLALCSGALFEAFVREFASAPRRPTPSPIPQSSPAPRPTREVPHGALAAGAPVAREIPD
jgi:hypothetical protein